MNARELAHFIDRTGTIDVAGMRVAVRILDLKLAYGRIDAQVEPLSGSGTSWVDLRGVILDEVGA